MQFGSCFIFSLFKGLCSLFCKPRPCEGGFLQQQQQVSLRIQELAPAGEEQRGPGRSQNWLSYFLYPKSSLWLPKGLDHHKPSLSFTS